MYTNDCARLQSNRAFLRRTIVNERQQISQSAVLPTQMLCQCAAINSERLYFSLSALLYSTHTYIFTFHKFSYCSTDPEADVFAAFTYQQLNRRQWSLVGVKLNNSSQWILRQTQNDEHNTTQHNINSTAEWHKDRFIGVCQLSRCHSILVSNFPKCWRILKILLL